MTRPIDVEDAILKAYLAARAGRHDEVMICLAFALAHTGRARDAARVRTAEGPFRVVRPTIPTMPDQSASRSRGEPAI